MPILNVIESKKLTNILVVVIRYFGGIKLGAGGLVRAYTNSVVSALEEADIVDLINGKKIEIIFDYNQEKNIKSLISDKKIIAKKYFEKVIYIVEISNNDIYLIEQFINKYEIIEDDIFLEK